MTKMVELIRMPFVGQKIVEIYHYLSMTHVLYDVVPAYLRRINLDLFLRYLGAHVPGLAPPMIATGSKFFTRWFL